MVWFNQADFNDNAAVSSMQHTTGELLGPGMFHHYVPSFLPASGPPPLNKQLYKKVKSRVSGKNLHSNLLIKSSMAVKGISQPDPGKLI